MKDTENKICKLCIKRQKIKTAQRRIWNAGVEKRFVKVNKMVKEDNI